MKYILLSILSITIFTFANSQNNYEEVVYLKNGSVIRGVIVEQIPNKSIKIQTADRNIFVYEMDEIEKISKEDIESSSQNVRRIDSDTKQVKPQGFQPKESGFWGVFDLGTITYFAQMGPNRTLFSNRIILGGRLSKHFSMGAELGFDFGRFLISSGGFGGFNTYQGILAIPVGLTTRTSFLGDSKATPFFDFGVGYHLSNFNTDFPDNGIYFSPAVGGKFWVSNGLALTLKLGYYGTYVFVPSFQGSENYHLNGLQFKFGLEW